jgi:MFS family permease
MLAWLAPMFLESGSSPTRAGLILGSFTVAFLFGNIVFGALSRFRDRRKWLAACAVSTSAGMIPLAMLPNLAPFLWISVSAFGLGGGFTLGMTLPLDNTHGVEEAFCNDNRISLRRWRSADGWRSTRSDGWLSITSLATGCDIGCDACSNASA